MHNPGRRVLLSVLFSLLIVLIVWRLTANEGSTSRNKESTYSNLLAWRYVRQYLSGSIKSGEAANQPGSRPVKATSQPNTQTTAPPASKGLGSTAQKVPFQDLNGSIWRRFGRPYHMQDVSSLVLSFKAPASTKKGLLVYGQTLEGVFQPNRRQFFAMTMSETSLTVWLLRADGKMQKVVESGKFNDDKWHTVTVSLVAAPTVVVHNDVAGAPSAPAGKSAVAGSKGFSFDSGLYIGAVVDRMSVTAYPEIHDFFDLFMGQLHSTVHINGVEVDLDSPSAMEWGVTDEAIGKYMSDVLKYDLTKPIAMPDTVSLNPTDPTMLHFPVVGAISDNHVDEMLDMPSSIVANMPDRGVLIYNLGLSARSMALLNGLCNVTVRGFRRDVYPELARGLHEMRWKPFILRSVMEEFGGVLYADASIRFKQSINSIPYFSKGTGFIGFSPLGVSPVSAFTHDGTMNALGMPRAETAKQDLTIGGIQVWIDRAVIRETLLRQWLGCALSQCMAPPGSSVYGCRFAEKPTGKFIGCHRYDQSAISVILMKAFHDNKGLAYLVNDPEDLKYTSIERGPTTHYPRCHRS